MEGPRGGRAGGTRQSVLVGRGGEKGRGRAVGGAHDPTIALRQVPSASVPSVWYARVRMQVGRGESGKSVHVNGASAEQAVELGRRETRDWDGMCTLIVVDRPTGRSAVGPSERSR